MSAHDDNVCGNLPSEFADFPKGPPDPYRRSDPGAGSLMTGEKLIQVLVSNRGLISASGI